MKWQEKPTVELNGFYNYAVHILRPKNTESSKPYLKNVGKKYQDKNELIIHIALRFYIQEARHSTSRDFS